MKLTIETTKTGWQQKLMIGGKVYSLVGRIGEDEVMRSDEGFSFSRMMERRGADPDLCRAVADAVDEHIEFELGAEMSGMVLEGMDE